MDEKQPAEVTDAALIRELVEHIERNTCTHEETHRGGAIWEICDACGAKWADDEGGRPEFKWPAVVEKARAILALRPTQVNTLAGCNCRWDGDTQVQWCELHLAHKEAIHEWAERAKSAEQKLALRPVQVPMTPTERERELDRSPVDASWEAGDAFMEGIYAAEAHHGITAQAKKE